MLGLDCDEVADDHQDRAGRQRERDAGADGETEDEVRRVGCGHRYGWAPPSRPPVVLVTVFVTEETVSFAVVVTVSTTCCAGAGAVTVGVVILGVDVVVVVGVGAGEATSTGAV